MLDGLDAQSPAPFSTDDQGDDVDSGNPDVWYLLFEQTPIALRWVFSIITGGLFFLASVLYRRQKNQLERIERQTHARMDRLEKRLDSRLDQIARLLTEVAANTRQEHAPENPRNWANE